MTTTEHCYSSFNGGSGDCQNRPLTNPAEPVRNHGWDNAKSDLIIYEKDVLINAGNGRSYIVLDALGQGTFGQVVKCWCQDTQSFVAVKVIKNQDAYFQQARVEIGILRLLNQRYDTDRHNIVRLHDYFVFREHLCLVFELLDTNLYELLKRNGYKGLSIQLVRYFVRQILDALATLRDERIIHCDLKPENILLKDQNSGRVKVIDFGSACLEHKTVYSYIQSRFYRSPEVVVGYPYNSAIDMWSVGCVAAELFLGLPLFPAESERDLLARIMEVLAPPPQSVLEKARQNLKYFKVVDADDSEQELGPPVAENDDERGESENTGTQRKKIYEFMTEEEFEQRNNERHKSGKRYFKHFKLDDIIGAYPYRQGISDEEADKERALRLSFTDFLYGVLDTDPHTRWTPQQAALHPFVTGDRFTGPFQPPPAMEPRAKTSPVSIKIPIPRNPGGMAATWHPDPARMQVGSVPHAAAAVHAQAHAAAMAVVQHLSPQLSPHLGAQFPSGVNFGGATNADPSWMSHSVPVPNHLPFANSSMPSGQYRNGGGGGGGGVSSEAVGMGMFNQGSSMLSQSSQGGGGYHRTIQNQGLSPGTLGTPSTVFHSFGTNQMSPLESSMFGAAFQAAQAVVGSMRSGGGLSVPSSLTQSSRPSQMQQQQQQSSTMQSACEGQQGNRIVGFSVPQPVSKKHPTADTVQFASAGVPDGVQEGVRLENGFQGGGGGQPQDLVDDLGTSIAEGDEDANDGLSDSPDIGDYYPDFCDGDLGDVDFSNTDSNSRFDKCAEPVSNLGQTSSMFSAEPVQTQALLSMDTPLHRPSLPQCTPGSQDTSNFQFPMSSTGLEFAMNNNGSTTGVASAGPSNFASNFGPNFGNNLGVVGGLGSAGDAQASSSTFPCTLPSPYGMRAMERRHTVGSTAIDPVLTGPSNSALLRMRSVPQDAASTKMTGINGGGVDGAGFQNGGENGTSELGSVSTGLAWGARGLASISGQMDGSQVRRRVQADACSLPVLQENCPMHTAELSGPYISDASVRMQTLPAEAVPQMSNRMSSLQCGDPARQSQDSSTQGFTRLADTVRDCSTFNNDQKGVIPVSSTELANSKLELEAMQHGGAIDGVSKGGALNFRPLINGSMHGDVRFGQVPLSVNPSENPAGLQAPMDQVMSRPHVP